MDLVAVVIGGILALAGSYMAERHAARGRIEAARRERLEAFRRELGGAVAGADLALDLLRTRGLHIWARLPEQLDQLLDMIDEAVIAARRDLLRAVVNVPSGGPQELVVRLDALRDSMAPAREAVTSFAVRYSGPQGLTPAEAGYDEAARDCREADKALNALVALVRQGLA